MRDCRLLTWGLFSGMFLALLGFAPGEARGQKGSAPLCRPAMVGTNEDGLTARLANPDPALVGLGPAAVSFGLIVDKTGKTSGVSIFAATMKSKPLESFIQQAARKSKFQPAMDGGKPVSVSVVGTALLTSERGKPVIWASLTTVKEDVAARLDAGGPQLVLDSARS